MTVYFLSFTPAALRLNGEYVGIIDTFIRRTEAEEGASIFVEAIPSDNRAPVNFMLDEKFLACPPSFCNVYLFGGDALVEITRYEPKYAPFRVIWQRRSLGNLLTLCSGGGLTLCVDGAEGGAEIYEVSEKFADSPLFEGEIGGRKIAGMFSGERLFLLSEGGKKIFDNDVKSYSLGNMLGVTVDFHSCAGAICECSYSYDGEKLSLVSGRTVETRPVGDEVKQFAFFESILTRAGAEAYLCDDLLPRRDDLAGYLGNFSGVIVPPQKFYERTREMRAAGLVYPLSANLFKVKFYSADMQGGKIINIREIDY